MRVLGSFSPSLSFLPSLSYIICIALSVLLGLYGLVEVKDAFLSRANDHAHHLRFAQACTRNKNMGLLRFIPYFNSHAFSCTEYTFVDEFIFLYNDMVVADTTASATTTTITTKPHKNTPTHSAQKITKIIMFGR